MTPAPQPHCSLEKICRVYHNRTFEYRKDLSCGMTCEHDTRSDTSASSDVLEDIAHLRGIVDALQNDIEKIQEELHQQKERESR
jgi:hypothetical protein